MHSLASLLYGSNKLSERFQYLVVEFSNAFDFKGQDLGSQGQPRQRLFDGRV